LLHNAFVFISVAKVKQRQNLSWNHESSEPNYENYENIGIKKATYRY